jgi:peptide/histidine transporter 3/4
VTLTQFYEKNANVDADTNNAKNENERGHKLELQLLGLLPVILLPIIAGFALPYIKPWSIRFGIPAICSLVSTVLFLSGSCGFTDIDPKGSPITTLFRVLVASTSKIKKRVPNDVTLLYNGDANANSNPNPNGPNPFQSAPNLRRLRCLYKAAVVLPSRPRQEQVKNWWTLCSVIEVEETKSVIRMIPMWTTFIICGLVLSIGNTYFLEQGNHMNRHLGRLKIPLPFFLVLYDSTKYVCIELYASIKVAFKRFGPPIGIGLAMVFSVLCCITAAKMEFRRIGVIRRHNLLDKPKDNIPMTLFLLLPQFLLLAALEGFSHAGITDFFASQAPPSMKNYLMHFTNGVLGVGIAGSTLSVYIVGKVSENNGKSNWFRYTLNKSRLDKYYWTLAALSGANLVVFVVVACLYSYRDRAGHLAAENEESPPPFDDNAECCSCFSN